MNRGGTDQDDLRLDLEIRDYLLRLIDQGYSRHTWPVYERILHRFLGFVERQAIGREQIFSVQTLESFAHQCRDRRLYPAIRGLARYLHGQGRISRPLIDQPEQLPAIYEEYLRYFAETRPARRAASFRELGDCW